MKEIFVPTPDEVVRTDDDCSAVTWRRGRKLFTLGLNCYGNVSYVRCALGSPPGGFIDIASFSHGWKWFCDDEVQKLPTYGPETVKSIGEWIHETFPGTDPESPRKSLRALEEMIELCLASGASIAQIKDTVHQVFVKEFEGAVVGHYTKPQKDKIPSEAADVLIVLSGVAHMLKFDLQAEVDKKMVVNRARRWKANGDGTGYHIKEPVEAPQPKE